MDLYRVISWLSLVSLIQFGCAREKLLETVPTQVNIENDVYDCIDIYKQPSLNHPLLKDHKIQMKSSSIPDWGLMNVSSPGWNISQGCPTGTVPILRSTPNDHEIFPHFFSVPPSEDYPGVHRAAVAINTYSIGKKYHGVMSTFSTHTVTITYAQASSAQMWVAAGGSPTNTINSIQVGWMVQPKLYGDSIPRFFGLWRGDNSQGCYNLRCPGFVQVSKNVPLTMRMSPTSIYGRPPYGRKYGLYQDPKTGNWWLTYFYQEDKDEKVGYWPKQIFTELRGGASEVGYGGFVQEDPATGESPPMGNGHYPNDLFTRSSFFSKMLVVNEDHKLLDADKFKIETFADSKCYRVQYSRWKNNRVTCMYGGPGGRNC